MIFETDISESNLLFAFNNNILKYKTAQSLTQTKSEITLGTVTVALYPAPDGYFWYNLKNLTSLIATKSNFEDKQDVSLNNALLQNGNDGVLDELTLAIKIYFSNGTSETITKSISLLNGFINLVDFQKTRPLNSLSKSGLFVLKPLPKLIYWYGLPFSISVYNSDTAGFTLKNKSSGLSKSLLTGYKVARLFFQKNEANISIDDHLHLNNGYNKLAITSTAGTVDFLLEKRKHITDGVYIKWLNSFGGWNYWQFFKGTENVITKELGVVNNNFNNIENTISPILNKGNTSTNSIALFQDCITKDEMLILRDLLDSVKVYLYTGIPFSKSETLEWVEVNLKAGTFNLSNPKEQLSNLSLTIEIPENQNRKL